MKYLVILLVFLQTVVYSAAFTSTQTGDFNDGGTWGNTSPGTGGTDFPIATGGDTFDVANTHDVTIPSGYTTITSGTIASGGELIVNGTLTLDEDLVLSASSAILSGTSGTINLGAFNIEHGGYYIEGFITLSGTSGSPFNLTGSGVIGTSSGYADFNEFAYNFTWVVSNGVGLTQYRAGTTTPDSIFTDCSFSNISTKFYLNALAEDNSMNFVRCKFDNVQPSSGRIELTCEVSSSWSGSGSGVRAVQDCSFKDCDPIWYPNGTTFTNTIFSDTQVYQQTTKLRKDVTFTNCSSYNTTVTSPLQTGNITYDNCYVYANVDNPHIFGNIKADTTDSNPFEVKNCVFEMVEVASPTDSSDIIFLAREDIITNIYNNIHIDDTGGYLVNANGGDVVGDVFCYNNTFYGDVTNALNVPSLGYTETGGSYSGTNVKFYNNLSYNTDGNITGANLISLNNLSTDDQLTYVDYNGTYNYLETSDIYTNVVIAGLSFGETGLGGNDIYNVDPEFFDPTRNIATWDASLGGAGTASNAITEMIAGTAGYTTTALLTYVKAGFAPTNSAYLTSGEGGTYIGAVLPVITSTGITYNFNNSTVGFSSDFGTAGVNYEL